MTNFTDIATIMLKASISKKAFWDIAFLLTVFSPGQMLEIFKPKFPAIDIGYIIHSLTNFDDANLEPSPVQLRSKSWEEIKLELQHAVIEHTQSLL